MQHGEWIERGMIGEVAFFYLYMGLRKNCILNCIEIITRDFLIFFFGKFFVNCIIIQLVRNKGIKKYQ